MTQTPNHNWVTGSLPPSPSPGLVPFGWARFFLYLPDHFQPIRLTGNDRVGLARIGDHDRVRFEIAWSTGSPRRKNVEKQLRKQANRKVKGELRRWLGDLLEPVQHTIFSPMLHVADDENQCDRWFGYAPSTGRFVDLVYHHDSPREDRLFQKTIVPHFVDQAVNEPTWWRVYDMHFVAPVGYILDEFKLLLGDMQVTLIRPVGSMRQPRCAIREIYPADLALQRQPLEDWLKMIVKQQRGFYLPRRQWLLGPRRYAVRSESHPDIGHGIGCTLDLRRPLGTLAFQMHRKQRHWLLHDTKRNRLLAIHIAHQPDRMDRTFADLVEGLHWDRRAD